MVPQKAFWLMNANIRASRWLKDLSNQAIAVGSPGIGKGTLGLDGAAQSLRFYDLACGPISQMVGRLPRYRSRVSGRCWAQIILLAVRHVNRVVDRRCIQA